MMHGVEYLVLAVRNDYQGNDDFRKVHSFLETLYISSPIQLPLRDRGCRILTRRERRRALRSQAPFGRDRPLVKESKHVQRTAGPHAIRLKCPVSPRDR